MRTTSSILSKISICSPVNYLTYGTYNKKHWFTFEQFQPLSCDCLNFNIFDSCSPKPILTSSTKKHGFSFDQFQHFRYVLLNCIFM